MLIRELRAWPVEMRRIDEAGEHGVVNVLVALQTDEGATGYGCAAPEAARAGESPEGIEETLTGPVRDLVRGRDPTRLAPVLEDLEHQLPAARAARAAVDMALLDLLAKVAGLPLWKLLGGRRDRLRTSACLPCGDVFAMLRTARARLDEGYQALHLRAVGDVEEDLERLRALRRAVGPEVELRFDGAGAFRVEEAALLAKEARDLGLEVFEQPTPAERPAWLGRIMRRAPMPVMADESVRSTDDALALAHGDRADHLRVGVQPLGGIAAAARVASIAHAAGLGVAVGCGQEAALGVAAGVALALGQDGVLYADLDGHLGLQDDPTAGLVRIRGGVLFPSEAPGLGWETPGRRATA